MTEDLANVATPLLALAGEKDPVSPPEHARTVAAGVEDGQSAVLENVAHQGPTGDPEGTASVLHAFFSGQRVEQPAQDQTVSEVCDAGMVVPRAVVSDARVGGAAAAAD